jgi:hypothetical protein
MLTRSTAVIKPASRNLRRASGYDQGRPGIRLPEGSPSERVRMLIGTQVAAQRRAEDLRSQIEAAGGVVEQSSGTVRMLTPWYRLPSRGQDQRREQLRRLGSQWTSASSESDRISQEITRLYASVLRRTDPGFAARLEEREHLNRDLGRLGKIISALDAFESARSRRAGQMAGGLAVMGAPFPPTPQATQTMDSAAEQIWPLARTYNREMALGISQPPLTLHTSELRHEVGTHQRAIEESIVQVERLLDATIQQHLETGRFPSA